MDSLKDINYCTKNNVPYNVENVTPGPLTTSPSQQVDKPQGSTIPSELPDIQATMAPHVAGLNKPAMWYSSLIKFWSWDVLGKDYAVEFFPVVRTCVTILAPDPTAFELEVLTSYMLCSLRVYKNTIVLREVAECLLHNNITLDKVLPMDYSFDIENCFDTDVTIVPDPMSVCIYSIGSFLNYPFILRCIVGNNMFKDLDNCGVTDFILATGLMVTVPPDEMCIDNEILSKSVRVVEFHWWAKKVHFSCIALCLVVSVMEIVAVTQITIAKTLQRYVFLILPLSTLWLVWKCQKLLFTDMESLIHFVNKVGFQLFSKIVESFTLTINTYLLAAITLEKYIAVSFPLFFKHYVHVVKRIFNVTIFVASLMSALDVIENIYFHIINPARFGHLVITHEHIEHLDFYMRLFSILSVSLRGVLPALICSVVNVVNTVKLCKRFYGKSDLPPVNSGRLKQNIVCSNMASVLIISCIVDPARKLYTELSNSTAQIDTAINIIGYVDAIGDLLLILSNGANLLYLGLLCPDLWKYYTNKIPCSRNNEATNQQRLVSANDHSSSASVNKTACFTSSVSVDNTSIMGKHAGSVTCAIDTSLDVPDGPYVY